MKTQGQFTVLDPTDKCDWCEGIGEHLGDGCYRDPQAQWVNNAQAHCVRNFAQVLLTDAKLEDPAALGHVHSLLDEFWDADNDFGLHGDVGVFVRTWGETHRARVSHNSYNAFLALVDSNAKLQDAHQLLAAVAEKE